MSNIFCVHSSGHAAHVVSSRLADAAHVQASEVTRQPPSEVVHSTVTASCGYKVVHEEQWSDVCGDTVSDEKCKSQCKVLASVIGTKMAGSPLRNRMVIHSS